MTSAASAPTPMSGRPATPAGMTSSGDPTAPVRGRDRTWTNARPVTTIRTDTAPHVRVTARLTPVAYPSLALAHANPSRAMAATPAASSYLRDSDQSEAGRNSRTGNAAA